MPYKTTRRAFQRAARGQCVTEFHKERRKKRDQIASVLSELLFDSVILCWFTRGVGIVLILACFFPCLDAVTAFSASGFSLSLSVSS